MKQFTKITAVLAALFLASIFVACGDGDESGNGEANGDSVVCKYVSIDDESTYLVFYADGTVESYAKNKLDYTRDMLRYEGKPLQAGIVSIKVAATGTEVFSFTVKESNGTLVPSIEFVPGFPIEYRIEKSDDDSAGGSETSTGGSTTGGSTSGGNTTGGNGTSGSGTATTDVVCTWWEQNNTRNYYIFYTDKTAAYYKNDVILYERSFLTYVGNPLATGTVTMLNARYDEGHTFSVSKSGTSIIATESDTKTKYTTKTSNSTENPVQVSEDTSDAVVCTYVLTDIESTYFIFYADGTVECYGDVGLFMSRSETSYEGNPMAEGVVKIRTTAGEWTFTVTASGSSFTATEISTNEKYIIIGDYDDSSATTGGNTIDTGSNGGNTGGSDGDSGSTSEIVDNGSDTSGDTSVNAESGSGTSNR